ncbi:MAG: NAD(P)-binding protein [Pseudomonadota bacterium]
MTFEPSFGPSVNPDAPPRRVAVIGAGVAGLAAARILRDHGAHVAVFEKSRGLGGRLATRRPFGRDDPFGLDHGAPFAEPSARYPETAKTLTALEAEAAAAAAEGGAMSASSVVHPLAARAPALRVSFETEIASIAVGAEDYLLRDLGGAAHGPFHAVIAAAPAPQTRALLGDLCPEAETEARYHAVAAVLAAFDPAPEGAAQEARIDAPTPPLTGVWRMGAKPGRRLGASAAGAREGWVGHAAPDWSAAHLQTDKDAIAEALWPALAESARLDPAARPAYLAGHRWRYGVVAEAVGRAYWLGAPHTPAAGLGCCGDWRLGPKAGDALASGEALGRALAARLATLTLG